MTPSALKSSVLSNRRCDAPQRSYRQIVVSGVYVSNCCRRLNRILGYGQVSDPDIDPSHEPGLAVRHLV